MLYREEFELERLRWRLRPGDLDLDRRRTGDLRLGDRDLTEEKACIRRQEQQKVERMTNIPRTDKNLVFFLKQNKLEFILHQTLLHLKGYLRLLKYSNIQGKDLYKPFQTTGTFLRGSLTLKKSLSFKLFSTTINLYSLQYDTEVPGREY